MEDPSSGNLLPSSLYLKWDYEESDMLLSPITTKLGQGVDLMGLIHTEMDRQKNVNTNSWKSRVLHLRSSDRYEFDLKSLSKCQIDNWDELKFKKTNGIISISSKINPRMLPLQTFREMVGQEFVPPPNNRSELNELWSLNRSINPIPYKVDLQILIQDNQVDLSTFDNPLKHICETNDISLAGIQNAYTLVGGSGSSSPTHYEDQHFGSVNKMIEGLSIWLIIDYSNNEKLIAALSRNQKIKCHALLASKAIITLPEFLDQEGIVYYLALQHPGDIIVTFPGAIHTVYNLCFTVKNALNFIPTRWMEPIVDHMDCYCRITRAMPPGGLGSARLLQHGQSLAAIIPNSLVLHSINAWLAIRQAKGKHLLGMLDPKTIRPPLLAKKSRLMDGEDFGQDMQKFKQANNSNKNYFCKVCIDTGRRSEKEAQMKKTAFNRHVAEIHVITPSTKWCSKCTQRFGDTTSYQRHKC